MRLLVVGGSQLMTWVVRHLVPAEIEVEHATTEKQVRGILRYRPPQVALFNVSTSPFPWREVQQLCRGHEPPIPVLFHSYACLDRDEAGIPEEVEHYFPQQLPTCELRRELHSLIRTAEGSGAVGEASPAVA